jgi:hypothetical protein
MDTLHTGKPEKRGLRPRKFVQYNLLPVINMVASVYSACSTITTHYVSLFQSLGFDHATFSHRAVVGT